jgi:hypothetical protein
MVTDKTALLRQMELANNIAQIAFKNGYDTGFEKGQLEAYRQVSALLDAKMPKAQAG